jgi:hypothetical protein
MHMKRSAIIGATVLALGAGLGASPAAAQTTLSGDVALNSQYFWRGVTYTNKFVIQPDLSLKFPLGPGSFTAGSWANIEPGQYNDASKDISQAAGISPFKLTEFDCWGEFNLPVGVATLTAGVTGYIFPNDSAKVRFAINSDGQYAGFTKADNTVEIYSKVALSVPLSPSLAVWYDVDKIKGAYFEGGISHDIPLSGTRRLTLGALAGLSASQGCEPDSSGVCRVTTSWNFQYEGLTHVDLSAAVGIPVGPLTITPNIHGIITSDPLTKITRPDPTSPTGIQTKDFKVVFGATIQWSKGLGGKKK